MGGKKIFSRPERAKNFSIAFRIVFRILFRAFQTVFRIDFKIFRGQIRSARVAALTLGTRQKTMTARDVTEFCAFFLHPKIGKVSPHFGAISLLRRRTNVQQLTCTIDLPFSFYYLFFSFVLLELKPFVLKGESPGEKIMKKCQKV